MPEAKFASNSGLSFFLSFLGGHLFCGPDRSGRWKFFLERLERSWFGCACADIIIASTGIGGGGVYAVLSWPWGLMIRSD
jgi:hypothetical protein